jgi:isocitrate dehydrogenase
MHTADLYREGLSEREVTTEEFTDALIARLGAAPERLRPAAFETRRITIPEPTPVTVVRERAGIDVYVCWDEAGREPSDLVRRLEAATSTATLYLTLVTNRGVTVHPGGQPGAAVSDHWRCRFLPRDPSDGAAEPSTVPTLNAVLAIPPMLAAAGLEVVGTEILQRIDGAEGYSSGASG